MTSYTSIARDEEEDRVSRKKTDGWIFGLLLLAIGLIPLIVGGYIIEVNSPLITDMGILASGDKGDIFTHYKAFVLLVITVVTIGLLSSKVLFMDGKIRKSKINIFLAIFAVAIVISTILSPSISIALWGQYNRSDGAISYLCYITLFFVAMNIEYPKKAIDYVMYALYPFVFINIILITMNFYGHDAMNYSIIQKIINITLPDGASLGEGSQILGTLNQWNYMSGMFAVMTVMFLAYSIVDTNKIRSFINVLVSVISFAIMLMSISTSGFLTVLVLSPLLIFLAIKTSDRKKGIVALLVFVIVSLPVFHTLAEKNPQVWAESIGFIIKENPYIEVPVTTTSNNKFQINLENRVYAAENSFELPTLPERDTAAGSGRAYIWGKTLEITMERPLFGYGLDTFVYNFPHYNIDARSGMWDENTIVDKPHSMYIGILYGTGIIGLIGFGGLAIITVFFAIKSSYSKKIDYYFSNWDSLVSIPYSIPV